MKEIKNDVIKKYSYENYVIYIKDTTKNGYELYEAYLQNEEYGVISLMFGTLKQNGSFEQFIEIVKHNLDSYIGYYKEEYKD